MELKIWKLLLIASGTGIMVACQKATPEQPVVIEEATPAPKIVVPSATPPPPSTPAVAAVADPVAPAGVFFLLQKISITTDDGIVGLSPGQVIREVSPGVFEADGRRVPVRPSQITNNLRIARQFAAADANTQAVLRAASAERPVVDTPAPSYATTRATGSHPAISAATPPPQPVVPANASALGSRSMAGSRLGGGTGAADPDTANKRNARMDHTGRLFWRDSTGRIRYDF